MLFPSAQNLLNVYLLTNLSGIIFAQLTPNAVLDLEEQKQF